MPKEETIEIINRENDPCETCGYVEGSPFCLQYCSYDAERKKEQEPCDDAISRADLGLTDFEIVMCNGDYKQALEMLIEKIQKAPSVTPNRRKGHWITEGVHWKPIFKCSECGSVIEEMPTVMDKPKYKGCPYCLAEMESEDEE